MKALRTVSLAAVALGSLALPHIAFAQDAPAAEEADADGNIIIVEARRRGENTQDVPLVVNTVTADKIEKLNLRDFRDIQTVVPGLTMASNANGIGTTSSVRGVNFDVNASGNNGTIEYYLNDSPLSSGALFQAMYDVGQIEVLRGPQGTLRGRASPSGSITIATRKPDLNSAGGYAQITANEIGGTNFNGAASAPIIDGMFAVRVAGLVERGRGNRVHSINSNRDPFARTKSWRISFLAKPFDWFDAEAMYQRIDTESLQFDQVACFNQFSATAPACPVTIDPEDRLSIKKAPQRVDQGFDIFTWKASAGFAGQRLYYVGSYLNQRVDVFAAQDDANVLPVVTGQFTSNDSKILNHEVRLQNEDRVAGLLDYVVGYFDNQLMAPSGIYSQTPLSNGATFLFNNNSASLRQTRTTEKSYFGNLAVHLLEDRLELSGGARHIKVTQNSSLASATLPGGVVLPNPATDPINILPRIYTGTITDLAFGRANRQFKKTIYSLSAKYRFNEDVLAYVNYGTSFRPGNNVVRSTVNARSSALENSFLVLPSETSRAYEIGLKTDFLDDTLKLNVAAFEQKFTNYPFRASSGVFYLNYATATTVPPAGAQVQTFNFVSPVPVRVRGVELEADYRPNDNLSLTANVAYALGKIRNGNVACLDLNGDGVPDNVTTAPTAAQIFAVTGLNNISTCPVNFRSMTASPINANFQGEYSLPLGDTAKGFLRTLVTYAGKSRNDPANVFDDIDAYARVNLYAGIRGEDGSWEVTLYGKNVFKTERVLATSNGPAFTALRSVTPAPSATINSPYISLGNASIPGLTPPREFGITARIAFGSR